MPYGSLKTCYNGWWRITNNEADRINEFFSPFFRLGSVVKEEQIITIVGKSCLKPLSVYLQQNIETNRRSLFRPGKNFIVTQAQWEPVGFRVRRDLDSPCQQDHWSNQVSSHWNWYDDQSWSFNDQNWWGQIIYKERPLRRKNLRSLLIIEARIARSRWEIVKSSVRVNLIE